MKSRGGRKPCKRVVFELGLPPPPDNYWVAMWVIREGLEVSLADEVALPGAVSLRIRAAITDDARVLLPDVLRHTCAFLVDRKIIAGAASIVDVSACWDRVLPEKRMSVDVRQTTPPRHRISAETRRRVVERTRQRKTSEQAVSGAVRARAREFERC